MKKLEGSYDPQQVESYGMERHKAADAYTLTTGTSADNRPFCISLPPPNVTGSLHMGHALNHTLQDILVRYARMDGRPTLWQPGTDHAGIATQMVVERQLAIDNIDRKDLGREAFVDKVWEWKNESGNTIVSQQRRLGESCDWTRQRFTMDDGLSQAVTKVFVELHRKGLLYRDQRLVNWDPKLQTAISDLEVENRDVEGSMWHIRYPLEGDDGLSIVVATTRPETLLGDTAVAVHPDDDRYSELVGRQVELPLTDRTIPIIADEYSDMEKGTGAVKITPAHDFNDFEVGKRNKLPMINILDEIGHINDNAPEQYQGLERFEARKRVVEDLENLGLLVEVESNAMTVPYGDRSGVVIEPRLTMQWYVDAHTLAQPALEAVRSGKTKFVPQHWEKTYFEWLENIQPWCVSRQLWWGHQIPAWYAEDGTVFVAFTEEDASEQAQQHFGNHVPLTRDQDVLDTWFSSALWPFSTLGWPEVTPELETFYPNSVLVTGFDIIFFWVARMMMMGLEFTGQVPFETVYIHALVRDANGQKMSKSKGNVIDPLTMIDKYGADALRFTLTAMAAMGRDLKLAEGRIEGYRHFGNKIFNAVRFCQIQEGFETASADKAHPTSDLDHWILARLRHAQQEVEQYLQQYRFNDIANTIYNFIWNEFCDWYLEGIKVSLQAADADRSAILSQLRYVVKSWMAMLHPVMPFITEYLWNEALDEPKAIHLSPWKTTDQIDDAAASRFEHSRLLVSKIRSSRTETGFPPSAKLAIKLSDVSADLQTSLDVNSSYVNTLARIDSIEVCTEFTTAEQGVRETTEDFSLFIPFGSWIDVQAEIDRVTKELNKIEKEKAKINGKLSNQQFLSKAPDAVIQKNKDELEALATRESTLKAQRERFAR